MRTDRQRDTRKLTVDFRYFANMPKNIKQVNQDDEAQQQYKNKETDRRRYW